MHIIVLELFVEAHQDENLFITLVLWPERDCNLTRQLMSLLSVLPAYLLLMRWSLNILIIFFQKYLG